MSQIEFEIGGVEYRADRLDAFKQLHASRKIAPILPKLIPVFVKLQQAGGAASLRDDLSGFAESAAPFADALAAMPDADLEYVVKTCMSVVKRKQGDAWAPLMAGDGATVMFSDMGLDHMLPIVTRVLRHSMGNFMQGLLANQPATPATPELPA